MHLSSSATRLDLELPHPTPLGAKIYHWQGGLLLLARTLVLDRPTTPIAATLRISLAEPHTIEVEGASLTARASLVGSKRCRDRITAIDSDLVLFYLPIEWPEYGGLRALLDGRAVVEIDMRCFDDVLGDLRRAFRGELDGPAIKQLARETVRAIAGNEDRFEIDERILRACAMLAHSPLDQFDTEDLARRLHVSSSWLRKRFKEQVGCALGEYARWSAVWQSVGLWRADKTLTQAAMEAGFYDLAHSDRAIVEVFGMSPSLATDTRYVTLVNCDS